MTNFFNKIFNRTTATTTTTTDLFTRISIHHNKNTRKVNQTTTVTLRGNKKEAIAEILRKGIPMTARELAHTAGFKLSYVASAFQYDKKNLPTTRLFKEAGSRKCMFSGNVAKLYTVK